MRDISSLLRSTMTSWMTSSLSGCRWLIMALDFESIFSTCCMIFGYEGTQIKYLLQICIKFPMTVLRRPLLRRAVSRYYRLADIILSNSYLVCRLGCFTDILIGFVQPISSSYCECCWLPALFSTNPNILITSPILCPQSFIADSIRLLRLSKETGNRSCSNRCSKRSDLHLDSNKCTDFSTGTHYLLMILQSSLLTLGETGLSSRIDISLSSCSGNYIYQYKYAIGITLHCWALLIVFLWRQSNNLNHCQLLRLAMSDLEETNDMSACTEMALLSWVRLHAGYESVSQLSELSNCLFFLMALESLPHFSLSEPVDALSANPTLSTKVSSIKKIAKGLIRYHQTQLLRDVSSFQINYVEFAMGNKQQIAKLLFYVISAVECSPITRPKFQEKLKLLDKDSAEVFAIIVENCISLGEGSGGESSERKRRSERSKIQRRFQFMQNHIEQLEVENKILKDELALQKQNIEHAAAEKASMKSKIITLMEQNDRLQSICEHTESQLKLCQIDQGTAKKKYEMYKHKSEESMKKLAEQLQKYHSSVALKDHYQHQNTHLVEINQEIQDENSAMRKELEALQKEVQEHKVQQRKLNDELICAKERESQLEIKCEQLNICNQDKQHDSNVTSYFGYESVSDSQKFRVRECLSWFVNEESYVIQEPSKEKKEQVWSGAYNNWLSGEVAPHSELAQLEAMKQNNSIYINNSGISFVNEKDIEKGKMGNNLQSNTNHPPKVVTHQEIIKFLINKQSQDSKNSPEQEEIHLLTSIIIELQEKIKHYQQMLGESLKQGKLSMQHSGMLRESRMQRYRSKVSSMFKQNWE